MSPPRRPSLATTGQPGLVQIESRVRAMADGMHADMSALEASDIAYTPSTQSDWVAPAPTTVQEALDRLAAAGGVTPVP